VFPFNDSTHPRILKLISALLGMASKNSSRQYYKIPAQQLFRVQTKPINLTSAFGCFFFVLPIGLVYSDGRRQSVGALGRLLKVNF